MLSKTKLKDITPIEFCRRIKSAKKGLNIDQVVNQEERGCFKEYCLILSKELNVPYTTIKTKWGGGISFPGMPARTRYFLKFVLFVRLMELSEDETQ